MDATETDVRRTGRLRRRRLTLGALLMVAATLATTLVVANPASAAAVCGHQVKVRNSIYYKACNAHSAEAGRIRLTILWRNDHGSPVNDIDMQLAYKIDGRITGGPWLENYSIPEDESRTPDWLDNCPSGYYVSFALRVKENDGSAGPWSVAPAVLCS